MVVTETAAGQTCGDVAKRGWTCELEAGHRGYHDSGAAGYSWWDYSKGMDLGTAESISRAQLLRLVESLGLNPNLTGSIQLAPDQILVSCWDPATLASYSRAIQVVEA